MSQLHIVHKLLMSEVSCFARIARVLKPIGKVKEIWIYPVKSMQGILVEQVRCYWYGINGDRKYAFIQHDSRNGFPWLTAREQPRLLSYSPYFADPNQPMSSPVAVKTPEGEHFSLYSPELLEQLQTTPASLVKLNRGTFDCMPVSIFTTQTHQVLEAVLDTSLDGRRFRANLIIDAYSDGIFPEQQWLGQRLVFGNRLESAWLEVAYPIKRCMMVNLDPETGASSPEILKETVKHANNLAGVYATVGRLGTIKVEDEVYCINHANKLVSN